MRRRALLASLPLLSGCSGLVPGTDSEIQTPRDPVTARRSPSPSSTPSSPSQTAAADEPYTVDGAERVEPQGFYLVNETDQEQYLTVVVEHEDETVFYENLTVPGRDQTAFRSVVASLGAYRVVVETADGARLDRPWLVRRGVTQLGVRLTADGLRSWQQATCDPDCRALDATGDAVDLPVQSGGGDRPAPVLLQNVSDATRQVDLTVGFDGETLLDYSYDLLPGLAAVVPVSNRLGVYDVTVATADSSRTYEWHTPEEWGAWLTVDEAGEFAPNCDRMYRYRDGEDPDGLRLDEIRNYGDTPRDVTVRVDADGRQAIEQTVTAKPHRETYLDVEVPARDRVDLVVELDTGARLEGTWGVCPHVGSLSLDVEAGELRLIRDGRTLLTTGHSDGSPRTATPE
jgi:hypothetical protein